MTKLIISTGVTENYVPRAQEYIDSLAENCNADEIVIVNLGFEKNDYPEPIQGAYLDPSVVRAKNPNNCIQHGAFVEALDKFDDDDIIFFTDADIKFQRPFDEGEIEYLKSLKHGQVSVNWNCGPDQTLAHEWYRLAPKVEHRNQAVFPIEELESLRCYNTGAVACTKKTWRDMYNKYVELFPQVDPLFGHYAKQQLLLSYLIQKEFEFCLMPLYIHGHNHNQGLCWRMGYHFTEDEQYVAYEGKIIVLRHHM